MVFWIKKIIAPFFQPLTVAILLLAIGCIMLWRRQKQRQDPSDPNDTSENPLETTRRYCTVGRMIMTTGVLWLVIISCSPLGGCLVHQLEYKYPAITNPADHPLAKGAKLIVVLGGGHSHGENIPATSELNLVTLARVVEAVRLHTALPNTKIIFSGGAVYETRPNASVMAAAAISLGVSPEAISTSTSARDTKGEAQAIADQIGDTPFLLVTSASHMPRSVGLFKGVGLDPIPAPTGQRTRQIGESTENPISVQQFFPSSSRITALERAIHEYLGMIWAKMRKQI